MKGTPINNVKSRYFLMCRNEKDGPLGVLLSKTGGSFPSEIPHTETDVVAIMGAYTMMFYPESVELTPKELEDYRIWIALEEFNNDYGIAYKADEFIPWRVETMKKRLQAEPSVECPQCKEPWFSIWDRMLVWLYHECAICMDNQLYETEAGPTVDRWIEKLEL